MVRLEKYKQLFNNFINNLHEGYSLDQALNEAQNSVNNYEGTLDGIAGKTFIAYYLLAQGQYNEVKNIVNSLELTNDNFVNYLILDAKSRFYSGMNDPSIDLSRAKEEYIKAQALFEKIIFQDKWEEGIIDYYRLERSIILNNDPSEKLNLINQLLEKVRTNTGIGDIKYGSLNNIGVFYRRVGKLDLAIDVLQESLDFLSKSDISIITITGLAKSYFLKNDLEKSKEFVSLGFKKFNQCTNYWLKSLLLETEEQILEHERKFEALEKNLIMNVNLANEHLTDLKIFEITLELLVFYLNRFKNTNNQLFLEKTRKTKNILDEIALKNPDDPIIQRLDDYAQALLFRLGTTKQKAKAIEIYEELRKIYPQEPKFKLDLVEMYWDDLEYDIDGEAKKQIDNLIEELQNLFATNNISLQKTNVNFQILLAKYNFYINGNTKETLESLYNLQLKAQSYGYKLIEEQIHKEITILENDSSWDSIDPSMKERLDRSKLKTYIEQAQMFIGNDLKL